MRSLVRAQLETLLRAKIFFFYILESVPFFTLKLKEFQGLTLSGVLMLQHHFYFLALHFRLSSLFSSLQLVDIFSYEAYTSLKLKTAESLVVYNFHGIRTQARTFVFTLRSQEQLLINSVVELFPNAWWLEREVSELHSVYFEGKKDVRNLMLQYGDTSHPFRKSYPSIGTREMFYDGPNDLIVQNLVTTQI